MATSTSTLGVEAQALTRLNRGRSDRYPCPHAAPAPTDRYAQLPGAYRCFDATGRGRLAHEYVVEGRDGRRCLWCGKRKGLTRCG